MSVPVAIKISGGLAASARSEAEQTDRSLTGQVEHWAKLGRALEKLLPLSVVSALKVNGGQLEALEHLFLREKVMAAISAVHGQSHFKEVSTELLAAGGERYEADPNDAAGVIRVSTDGSRTPGKIVQRKFVPSI